jgi:hypothetical protein
MNNQTRTDAIKRIVLAKVGSLGGASEEFLLALRECLFKWIQQIEVRLYLLNCQKVAKSDIPEGYCGECQHRVIPCFNCHQRNAEERLSRLQHQ